ncbi:MAG: hypothetical protein JSS65_11370 [Armatimonadetes bacterium]|nr:hypothetical protein [Armatimonadota bacterium]
MNLQISHRLKGGLAVPLAALAATAMVFGGASVARAQTSDKADSYAVVDFAVKNASSDVKLGEAARDAFRSELAKINTLGGSKIDAVATETVVRALADLGLMPPIEKNSDLIRLGQTVGANFVVTGTVYNYRVVTVDGGKQGQVIVQAVVRDVSSGMVVNGTAATGFSGTRGGDVSASSLLTEALADAAFKGFREMSARTLPRATILNTLGERALINKGIRSGFTMGQKVIVRRRADQVAEGQITELDPDSGFVQITRYSRGIQPGDKVEAIFSPPVPTGQWQVNGNPKTERANSKGGSNQSVVSALILVVLLGFLLAQGRGSNNDLAGDVKAEAIMQANDTPGVRVSWTRDSFLRGNNTGPVRWQVWRAGETTAPAIVVDGSASSGIDDVAGTGRNFGPISLDSSGGNSVCAQASLNGAVVQPTTQIAPGIPFQYAVEVVYRVDIRDLPGSSAGSGGTGGNTSGGTGTTSGGTGTTSGTTGTTSGTTGTTSGTTGTTSGTTGTTSGTTGTTSGTTGTTSGGNGSQYCYFISGRVQAQGIATPLSRTTLQAPVDGATVLKPTSFQWTSVRGSVGSLTLEYVVQVSTSPTFPSGATTTLPSILDNTTPGGQSLSSTVDPTTLYPSSTILYWRVGAKNIADSPGPVPDASGFRYIFSGVRTFRR